MGKKYNVAVIGCGNIGAMYDFKKGFRINIILIKHFITTDDLIWLCCVDKDENN